MSELSDRVQRVLRVVLVSGGCEGSDGEEECEGVVFEVVVRSRE